MISTISGVTDLVDSAFMTVITFVAFFIISVALLRNVLAGAYCAFPKFWDQVHDAHKENEDKAFFESIKGIKDSYKTASMGTLKTAVFRIVPDIKVMTDFDEGELSAKDYFIKAIPQMIIVVIIGVFIYNGYYRDFTSLVASTGAEFIDRTILSFDPVGAFDTLMNTSGRPAFASDDSMDEFGKRKNRIANDIYDQIITKYTDIKDADTKAALAGQIDNVVDEIFSFDGSWESGWLGNEDGSYDIVYRVEMVKALTPSNATKTITDSPDRFQYAWRVGLGKEDTHTAGAHPTDAPMTNNIIFDSTVNAINEQWYISVKIGATRHVVTEYDNQGGATATLNLKSDGTAYTIYTYGKPTVSDATATITYTKQDNTTDTLDVTIDTEIGSAVGSWYPVTFKVNQVNGVTVPTTGTVTFSGTLKLPAQVGSGVKTVSVTSITISNNAGSIAADTNSGYTITMTTDDGKSCLTAEKKPATGT